MQNDIKIVCFSRYVPHFKIRVPTAIKVAKELGDSINFIGIRLDSGDIAYLSKKLVVCLMMQALKTQKSLLQMI